MPDKTFGRSRPSRAQEMEYRKALQRLVDLLRNAVAREMKGVNEQNLKSRIRKLTKRFYPIFHTSGDELARWLADKSRARTLSQLQRKLKEEKLPFRPLDDPEETELMRVIVKENVDLIRSLPKAYLQELETGVRSAMRRVGDAQKVKSYIDAVLERCGQRYRNQASLIARDQIQKATQSFALETAKKYGARQGRWIHVPGKFSSRKTHIKMDKRVFDLDKGLYDPDVREYVRPGQLAYCNCQFEVIFPGFSAQIEKG